MPRPTPRKPGLSCRVIADRAIRLADTRGLEALTMRSLAAELGVEAMSLYSHFANKDELVDAMASRLLLSVELPPLTTPPRRRLLALANSIRRLGHRHPNLFPLVILRPQSLETALRTTEYCLAALFDAGLPVRRAIRAQRTILCFVRGYTLWEIGGFATGRRPGPGRPVVKSVLARLQRLDPQQFPSVTRAARQLVSFSPDRDFRRGLTTVLDAVLPPNSPSPPAQPPKRAR